jgi:hypothetical protein
MEAFGGDRIRAAGGKVILSSLLPKGWTPRTPKTLTSAEHPGTAVSIAGEFFEVISAEVENDRVRYVLAPWKDEHTIRSFEIYDEASETRRAEDHALAHRQRRGAVAAALSSFFLGHLPAQVQRHLANHFGVTPSRMTILSAAAGPIAVGVCVWIATGATLKQSGASVPVWLWLAVILFLIESAVRFFVAMSQDRGMGSVAGAVVYSLFWFLAPRRAKLPSPFASERGHGFFTLDASEEEKRRDTIHVRGPLVSLLTPGEQAVVAQRYGFDYRQHSYGLTWIILGSSVIGFVTSLMKFSETGRITAASSMIVSVLLGGEQVRRLFTLNKKPAGSVLGLFARPFVRDLLERG